MPGIEAGGTLWPSGGIDPLEISGQGRTKPVVIAMQGRVFTIGIELALASDIRLCSDDATFAQLEIARGIFPFGGATFRAPAQLGLGQRDALPAHRRALRRGRGAAHRPRAGGDAARQAARSRDRPRGEDRRAGAARRPRDAGLGARRARTKARRPRPAPFPASSRPSSRATTRARASSRSSSGAPVATPASDRYFLALSPSIEHRAVRLAQPRLQELPRRRARDLLDEDVGVRQPELRELPVEVLRRAPRSVACLPFLRTIAAIGRSSHFGVPPGEDGRLEHRTGGSSARSRARRC